MSILSGIVMYSSQYIVMHTFFILPSTISYMYILTYLYILAETSAYHLQLKCMGGHFISGHPYIESTTVLSDY